MIKPLRRQSGAVLLLVIVIAVAGIATAIIWPFTDLIAAHDVGSMHGMQRLVHLQTAREAVRTQMITLGAAISEETVLPDRTDPSKMLIRAVESLTASSALPVSGATAMPRP